MPTASQWREAANVLREHAAKFDQFADYAICAVVSLSGPNLEPLACGYKQGHEGDHAWGTLPTFVRGVDDTDRVSYDGGRTWKYESGVTDSDQRDSEREATE